MVVAGCHLARYMHENAISTLPPEWSGMPSLENLQLYQNSIPSVPVEWSGMPSLKTL